MFSMALVPCGDCDSKISDQAWSCPQCGWGNIHKKLLNSTFYDEDGYIKIGKLATIAFVLIFGTVVLSLMIYLMDCDINGYC